MGKKLTMILAVFFFIVDRILKEIALKGGILKSQFFNFSLFKNTGLLWGLKMSDYLYFPLIILVFLLLLYFLRVFANDSQRFFYLNLILFSGLSNFLDRIFYGFVVDYFQLAGTVFNLSDFLIFLSVFGLTWLIFKGKITKIRR